MVSETELLEAMRNAPDDLHKRAVYTDFLEETGRPEYAECLRVEQRFHTSTPDERAPVWASLVGHARPLESEWQGAALRAYDIVLDGAERKIRAIKEIRFLLGVDLRTAKSMVQDLPATVVSGLPGVYAFAIAQRLQRAALGPTRLVPGALTPFPTVRHRRVLTLHVDAHLFDEAMGPWHHDPVDPQGRHGFNTGRLYDQMVVVEMLRHFGADVPPEW